MLQVSYAGSKGTRLYTFYDANQAAPSSDASAPSAHVARCRSVIAPGTVTRSSTQAFPILHRAARRFTTPCRAV